MRQRSNTQWRVTHHDEIRQEREDKECGVEHDVNGEVLSGEEVGPWPSRIVPVVDIDQLDRVGLDSDEDGFDSDEKSDVCQEEQRETAFGAFLPEVERTRQVQDQLYSCIT